MRFPFLPLLAAVIAALTLGACGSSASSSSASSSTASSSAASSSTPSTPGSSTAAASSGPQLGYEGVAIEPGPAIAPPTMTSTKTVDGIRCGATEQLAYHIHAHLAVFVSGVLQSLPAGVGIPGSTVQASSQGPLAAGGQCIYWLHTHTADGIIHVESPTERVYTLGNFFDEWGQPLSGSRVGAARGHITAYLNGKLWRHDVRSIPLLPHGDIQLDIGEPAPPLEAINWSQTSL